MDDLGFRGKDAALINLLNRITGRGRKQQLIDLVREVSDQSQHDVWDRVRDQAVSMPLAQARGYIRARAESVIRRQLSETLQNQPELNIRLRQKISSQAGERVVHLMVGRLVTRTPALRRAA